MHNRNCYRYVISGLFLVLLILASSPVTFSQTRPAHQNAPTASQRPYVPMQDLHPVLRVTPEEVAREILIGIKPGIMEFPRGRVEAAPGEFSNTFSSLQAVIGKYNPERVIKAFPRFNPATDSVKFSPKTGRNIVLYDYSRIYKLRLLPGSDRETICKELENVPGVLFAEPNGTMSPNFVPNDPFYSEGGGWPSPQWNLDRIRAPEAWDLTQGSASTLIAILDGGIHSTGVEFAGRVTGDEGYAPLGSIWHWHGTAVASIAAANTNNGAGIAGIDWHATLLSKRIDPGTDFVSIANKILESVLADADIINFSAGNDDETTIIRQAFGDAYKAGIVNVTSMGNENTGEPLYPAAYTQRMLSVGAIAHAQGDPRWESGPDGSNWGPHIDIAAPGDDIPAVKATGASTFYDKFWATSSAAPHVSGTAGLILAYYKELFNEDLTNEDVYEIIKRSAEDIHGPGFDETSGYGMLDARNALDLLRPPYVLLHQSTGGSDAGVTNRTMTLIDFPGLSSAVYVAKQHEIRQTVNFGVTFESPPGVWGNPSTVGFSAANPNYGLPWCGAVPGTITTTGCEMRTFVFEVFADAQFLGWFPTTPDQAVMNYTVHGIGSGGDVLLADDFNDGNADGWGNESGTWSVSGGAYSGTHFTSRGSTGWTDYTTEFDFADARDGGVFVRAQDVNNAIVLVVRPNNNDIYWHVRQNGYWGAQYNSVPLGFAPGSAFSVKVLAQGNSFTAYVNGIEKTSFASSTFPNGKIVLYSFGGGAERFDNVTVVAAEGSGGGGTGLLLSEDFNDGNAKDGSPAMWTDYAGTWGVENGKYVMQSSSEWITRSYTHVDASEYVVEADVKFSGNEGKVIYSHANQNEHFRVDLIGNGNFRLVIDDVWHDLGGQPISPGVWYHVKVEATASRVKAWLDGVLKHDRSNTVTPNGYVGVGTYGSPGYNQAHFDSVVVSSIEGGGGGGGGGDLPLTEDFNDGNAGDGNPATWTDYVGTWHVVNGEYMMQNSSEQITRSYTHVNASGYVIEADVKFLGNEGKVLYSHANQNEHFRVDLISTGNFRLVIDNVWHDLYGHSIGVNVWHHVKIEATSSQVKAWLNGQLRHDRPNTVTPDGYVGVGTFGSPGYNQAYFDNFVVQPAGGAAKPVVLSAMELGLPDTFSVAQNTPNPFNPQTTIRYALPEEAQVMLKVYNLLGQEVRTLVDRAIPAGYHRAVWDGRDAYGREVANGVYLYRLIAGDFGATRKMLILK